MAFALVGDVAVMAAAAVLIAFVVVVAASFYDDADRRCQRVRAWRQREGMSQYRVHTGCPSQCIMSHPIPLQHIAL